MPHTHTPDADTLLDAFEGEWRAGNTPSLDQYTPPPGKGRVAALRELCRMDLEYRTKRGEAVRVEEYLQRYPDLAADPSAVAGLAVAEYELRSRREPGLDWGAYLARFPDHAEALKDARRLPDVPGYEIREEIGRGGMGVVYRAWQRGPERFVALKILRDLRLADESPRARFRAEAAAVGRLQHPNVVQVFDAGEADGMPYLALEYVTGGSLDRRLATGPLSPGDAARLTVAIAGAVRAAHQAGILHRDLKPGNVLLDDQTGPKVTDFGLAKFFADDAGPSPHTATGAVVGTPSYMPPEQIGSIPDQLGPASDVYAVGAILYECLTGRPPFRGSTVLDTLDQVRTREPVPVRQLQPSVPRDLETVCLKCLRKEPGKRYASAAELADDLARFLDGRPVLARPVSAAERAWKWARRRPAIAALSAFSVLAVAVVLFGSLWYNARLTRERNRAEASADRALKAADVLVAELAEGIRPIAGTQSTRIEEILRRAGEVYDGLAEAEDSPRVRLGKARMHTAFAEVYFEMNLLGKARENAEAALKLFRDLGDEEGQASAHFWIGRARERQGSLPDAFEHQTAATELWGAAIERHGESPDRLNGLADAMSHLGYVHMHRGEYASAEPYFERALIVSEGLSEARPSPESRHLLALAWERRANHLWYARGGSDPRTREGFARAAELFRALADEFPWQGEYQAGAARNCVSLVQTHSEEKPPLDAVAAVRLYADRVDDLVRMNPENIEWRRVSYRCHGELAMYDTRGESKDKKPEQVIAEYRERVTRVQQVLDSAAAALARDPTGAVWRADQARMSLGLGDLTWVIAVAEYQRDPAKARLTYEACLGHYLKARVEYDELIAMDMTRLDWREGAVQAHLSAAQTSQALGRGGEAVRIAEAGLALVGRLRDAGYGVDPYLSAYEAGLNAVIAAMGTNEG